MQMQMFIENYDCIFKRKKKFLKWKFQKKKKKTLQWCIVLFEYKESEEGRKRQLVFVRYKRSIIAITFLSVAIIISYAGEIRY